MKRLNNFVKFNLFYMLANLGFKTTSLYCIIPSFNIETHHVTVYTFIFPSEPLIRRPLQVFVSLKQFNTTNMRLIICKYQNVSIICQTLLTLKAKKWKGVLSGVLELEVEISNNRNIWLHTFLF